MSHFGSQRRMSTHKHIRRQPTDATEDVPPSAFDHVLQQAKDSPVLERKNSFSGSGEFMDKLDLTGFSLSSNDTVLERLSLINKEKSAAKRMNVLLAKLDQCCTVFDFAIGARSKDVVATARSKVVKKNGLNEIITYVTQQNKDPFTDEFYSKLAEMIAANAFRSLAPADDPTAPDFDPEDDEPRLERSWEHLGLVYQLFIKVLESKHFKANEAIEHFSEGFITQLISLFNSEDPRERDMLKTCVHRIYGRFMPKRDLIRQLIRKSLLMYTFQNETLKGVAEILEFLGCIINGFTVPLKLEHRSLLLDVLMPLHRGTGLSVFHRQLTYCVVQFINKSSDLTEPVFKRFIRTWPKTNASKQVLLLNEIESILRVIEAEDFPKIRPILFKLISRCIESTHFMVSERALNFFRHHDLLKVMDEDRRDVFPVLVPALLRNAHRHWSGSVHDHNDNAMEVLKGIDEDLFTRCSSGVEVISTSIEGARIASVRADAWRRIEAAARSNPVAAVVGVQMPDLITACPDIYLKGENTSPHKKTRIRSASTHQAPGESLTSRSGITFDDDEDEDDDEEDEDNAFAFSGPGELANVQARQQMRQRVSSDSALPGENDDDDDLDDADIAQQKLMRRKSMIPKDPKVLKELEAYRADGGATLITGEFGEDELDLDAEISFSAGKTINTHSDSNRANTHSIPTDDYIGIDDNDVNGGGDEAASSRGQMVNTTASSNVGNSIETKRSSSSTSGCWMRKRSSSTFSRAKKRWFTVGKFGISYYASETMGPSNKALKTIQFREIKAVVADSKLLRIVTPQRTYSLTVENERIPIEWERELRDLVAASVVGTEVYSPGGDNDSKSEGIDQLKRSDSSSSQRSVNGLLLMAEGKDTSIATGSADYNHGASSKKDCIAAVESSSSGDFCVRLDKSGTKVILYVNDEGTALSFVVNIEGDKYKLGQILCDSIDEVIDELRVHPPKNKAGKRVWLMEGVPPSINNAKEITPSSSSAVSPSSSVSEGASTSEFGFDEGTQLDGVVLKAGHTGSNNFGFGADDVGSDDEGDFDI